ncbi:DUF2489 domain-containing protein [Alteromonas oceanisediminis]|uniref:DUF2489 domain-containing protein n=1 Tax=Alteromonas oceanisediminis TaxID=2836180 RepID=UPI001BD92444|nr:DUF2489 domain-containing protein [Alteromonas oceanisediminis]MBT0586665.1 DUF2489 domain-containing protein [Alteromonas oceanisediminis]
MLELLIAGALLIVVGLSFYAGRLLFQLKQQTTRQTAARQVRIDNITQSIQTIALAMEQQQCNLSEGVIRICNLLDAMPLTPQPNYRADFPATYELYEKISHFPTHDARNALTKLQRRTQDNERENIESEYESKVLMEVSRLKNISA